MIVGSVSRREYLEHHEPSRWPIRVRAAAASDSAAPETGDA